ncbi:MAG: outer membrane protein assembly factor BamB family protein [Planctomycetota bacterium]|jgi:outer membrane protein assembly factor BamB
MNRLMALTVIVSVVTVFVAVDIYAGPGSNYWPMWRGPDATGVAERGAPPLTWSETENIKWKVKVPGHNSSSPVIWGNKIFFQTAIETDKKGPAPDADKLGDEERPFHDGESPTNIYKFDVVCMDRKTGKILWQKTAREEMPHEGHHEAASFASYSPVTDGKYVWASFGSRGTHCYDVNGNHKWSRELGKMKTRNAFGEGASPALAGDALIVLMDQEGDSFIYALDKKTGRTIWKDSRDEGTGWTTPVVVEIKGRLEVIVNAPNQIQSYDAETGDVIWQCSGMTRNAIPAPVVGFGRVFCTSGFRGSALLAIELGRTGDLTDSEAIAWQVSKATPYVPSPLLYGENIYVLSVNRGVISSYNARTGKPNFVKKRLDAVDEVYASPVGAAGRVYVVSREGKCQVIRNSKEFEVLATNTLDDEIDASPAIVGDRIFLKGKTNFYCIGK